MNWMANEQVMFRKLSVCCIVVYFTVVAEALWCPGVCECRGNEWDCSGLENLEQLWADDSWDTGRVKRLYLHDSRVNFQEKFKQRFSSLEVLELRDCQIHCSQSSVWLLDWSGRILQPESLTCTSPPTVNSTSLLKALNLINEVSSQCPDRCSCELFHMERRSDEQSVTVEVNCKNQSYSKLPQVLPRNVIIHLDLSNNQIEDVSELASNPIFNRVTVLNLNQNQVKSISSLKNSHWIGQFSLLSLQGNHLEELPTQALNKVFANHTSNRDIHGIRMFLSNNPWKCNCLTITQFQSFMANHKELIKDVGTVTCGPDSDGEVAGQQIISLELGDVCNPDNADRTDKIYWYTAIGILAVLFVLISANLAYDCRVYQKKGKLPRITTSKYFCC